MTTKDQSMKPGPHLELRVRFLDPHANEPFELEVRLANVGDQAAQQPAVLFEIDLHEAQPIDWAVARVGRGFTMEAHCTPEVSGAWLFEPEKPFIVYSGMDRLLCFVKGKQGQTWESIRGRGGEGLVLALKGALYALGMPTVHFEHDVGFRDQDSLVARARWVLGATSTRVA